MKVTDFLDWLPWRCATHRGARFRTEGVGTRRVLCVAPNFKIGAVLGLVHVPIGPDLKS